MAPKAMKGAAMKAAVMTKGALADAMASECELKKSVVLKLLAHLAEIATGEVKKSGVFTLPGLVRIKTRKKPATKAGKREIFGKMVVVKAKPAKTVVKAFPVAALKKEFEAGRGWGGGADQGRAET
eukprot:CAMPEP_0179053874 /NCGR_PEP_ID=MMETSP0796-20121207/22497_1 /TAXON_ID=73915 /ORGANISM="Pyrodinium bahamense, Strain pbaha01" /LENGTH=125 /DNA_ID=CAMNT_0020750483 /DNA_START=87 /DNA_END=461 /DNA_ORIENTATION=-